MATSDDDYVTHVESDIRWSSHAKLHDMIDKIVEGNVSDHDKVHKIHEDGHNKEHEMTQLAMTKAEHAMDRRLEGMNEFRDQLNKQAAEFLTRGTFDKYAKDAEAKVELALSTSAEKEDALLRSIVNRHDADFNSLRELLQTEKEIRKAFEGSINTWKWLAGFLGASGVAGVILLFATRGT